MSQSNYKKDPLFYHLEVPCICRYEDFCSFPESLLEIPERFGLCWDKTHLPGSTGLNQDTAGPFLQGWLFFSLLSKVSSIFGVAFQPHDFVSSTSDGRKLVTGYALSKYCWFWCAATWELHGEDQRICLVRVKPHLDVLHQVVNAWSAQIHVPLNASLDRTILSLMLFDDVLRFGLGNVFNGRKIQFFGSYAWAYPPSLKEALLRVGWCRGELQLLFRTCTPSTLLYLTTIDRNRPEKTHTRCTDSKCLTNQLDEDSYTPAHAPGCHAKSCAFLHAPIQQIRDILQDGGIPIVRLIADDATCVSKIEARALMLRNEHEMLKYVAISHVWSDGMGNPRFNALPTCQVNRIQCYVDALAPCASVQHGHTWFWMDTLCVPLDPETRRLAIIRMAKTYLHADKVLVIDNWLCQYSESAVSTDLLIKIAYSDWNTRLWTFQESILARERYFQCGERAFAVTALNTGKNLHCLEEVSSILAGMTKSEILRSQSAQTLLRALTSKHSTADRLIEHYAGLPPQDDLDEEELRLNALELREIAARGTRLRERWLPLCEEVCLVSHDPDLDERLKAFIGSTIPVLDSVYCNAGLTLQRSKGTFFELAVNRLSDLAGDSSRQLKAFEHRPATLLLDVASGLPGRMTSKMEDETICLGGVIGLDVGPLLSISSGRMPLKKQAKTIQEQRMMKFLSMVEEFPASILFWESDRLSHEHWRWAPSSFLDRRACKFMLMTQRSKRTSEGLLCEHSGIRLPSKGFSRSLGESQTLALHWTEPIGLDQRSYNYQWRKSWQNLELRPSNVSPYPGTSWSRYLDPDRGDLAIIIADIPENEGVLVRLIREDNNILYSVYLANVARVIIDSEREHRRISVNAAWAGTRTWCVG